MVWFAYFISEPYSHLIEKAFETLSNDEDVKAIKIQAKDILLNFNGLQRNCCFILSEFSGEAFDFLVSQNASIFGPNAILDCIKQEQGLPKYDYPLFSRKLKAMKICVSQIDSTEKAKLFKMIEMMEGVGYEKLTNSVKVLLTRTVDSQKYVAAHLNKIHVLFPDWIYENWNLSSQIDDYNPFSRDCLEKYRIPIFFNLKICLSGFSGETKSTLKKLIETNGGIYFSELKNNEVTHLVTGNRTSQKFIYAKQWKIRTVTGKWLTDSIEEGYCLEFSKYDFPDNDDNINNGGKEQISEKSYFESSSIATEKSLPVDALKPEFEDDLQFDWDDWDEVLPEDSDVNTNTQYSSTSNTIDTGTKIGTTETNLFFNCLIHFHGCSAGFIDKWQEIIIGNQGKIALELNDERENPEERIFVVVVGEGKENLIRKERWKYVNRNWLEESWTTKRLLPVEEFIVGTDENRDGEDSDYFQENLNLFSGCIIGFHGCRQEFIDKWKLIITNLSGGVVESGDQHCCSSETSSTRRMTHIVVDDDSRLSTLSQYIYVRKSWLEQSFDQNRLLPIAGFLVTDGFDDFGFDLNELDSSIGEIDSNQKETVIIDTNSSNNNNNNNCCSELFSLVSFFIDQTISNYSSLRLIKSITQNGGQIVVGNPMNANYIVADNLVRNQYKCGRETNIVTEFFIRRCLIDNRLVDRLENFLYCPIVVSKNGDKEQEQEEQVGMKLLVDCVITFSGFDSIETEELVRFAQRLGATVQEIIMQKECTNKRLKRNSHVIAADKNSNGFKSAVQWNIPVVRKEWLHCCVVRRAKQNYAGFLLDSKQRFDWQVASSAIAASVQNEIVTTIVGDNSGNVNSGIASVSDDRTSDASKHQEDKEINKLATKIHTVITRSLKRKNSESTQIASETVKATERKSVASLLDRDSQKIEVGWNYEISNDVVEADNPIIKTEVDKENIKRPRHASVSASPIVIHEQKKKTSRSKTQTKEINIESKEVKTQLKTNNNIGKEINIALKEPNPKPVMKNSMKVFAFKGLSDDEILKTSSIIYNLGGRFIQGTCLTSEVTHLISKDLNRDVKILAAISAGIWLLHYSYINASAKESKWLEEEKYEWGVQGTLAFFSKNSQECEFQKKLASAAKKWRKYGVKAFDKWRIILIESSGKTEAFRRVFNLGGAEVLTIINSFPAQSEFTHAILNKKCDNYTGIQLPLDYKWINIKYLISHLLEGKVNNETIKPSFFYSKQEIIDFNKSILQKSKTKKS